MTFYTVYPIEKERGTEGYKNFHNSPWCGEGYDTRSDAMEHKKFFEKNFGVKFEITKEEL